MRAVFLYAINVKEFQHIQYAITIIVTKFTLIIALQRKKIYKVMQDISLALYFVCFPLHFQELATVS
jgi:hypothetical protein